jgi:hypothetical protein
MTKRSKKKKQGKKGKCIEINRCHGRDPSHRCRHIVLVMLSSSTTTCHLNHREFIKQVLTMMAGYLFMRPGRSRYHVFIFLLFNI